MARKCIVVAVAVFAFCSFFFPATGFSSEADAGNQIEGGGMSAAELTKKELLLFWDEKDLYVQSATRHEKPISQAAENMTVITAKEIRDMNAHTVAEVLNRVTGVFVDFAGQDFGSASLLHIQSSTHPSGPERHVLVLLDGIEWNLLTDGHAETNSIPVGIIDRIEVIKGPASSSWGSSLGGVINIITKDVGNTSLPSGTLSASYGKSSTQDYRAELSGEAGPVGYYLYAGKQESDGLRNNRSFANYNLYSKFSIPVSRDLKLGLTVGYSDPHLTSFELPAPYDFTARLFFRTLFVTGSLEANVAPELTLNVSLRTFKQKGGQLNNVLSTGELILNNITDEETTGGTAQLICKHGPHTAVLGLDASHGRDDQTLEGVFSSSSSSAIDKWAVFANDTIAIGRFSLTPGIRYDHNNITGSFVSPSLGATYKLAEKTILRASLARGFTIPPLSFTTGGAYFLDPNPNLKSESVWSYQAGVESGICDYLWIKATAFYDELSDAIVKQYFSGGPPGCTGTACNDIMENKGSMRRKGAEFEAETAPVHNLSLKAGFAFVNTSPRPEDENATFGENTYEYNLALKYEEAGKFMAELFGHYIWWNLNDPLANLPKYNAFVWDLNLRKRIYTSEKRSVEVFLSGHNIFNGSQYTGVIAQNPGRWVEAGLRLKF
jgi:vitamin B12 transporter